MGSRILSCIHNVPTPMSENRFSRVTRRGGSMSSSQAKLFGESESKWSCLTSVSGLSIILSLRSFTWSCPPFRCYSSPTLITLSLFPFSFLPIMSKINKQINKIIQMQRKNKVYRKKKNCLSLSHPSPLQIAGFPTVAATLYARIWLTIVIGSTFERRLGATTVSVIINN